MAGATGAEAAEALEFGINEVIMLQKNYAKNRKSCRVTFILPAEAAEAARSVFLVGDFNNWDKEGDAS